MTLAHLTTPHPQIYAGHGTPVTNPLIFDLFAGPGGWDQGARDAGYTGRLTGIEWDTDACETARAAGHDRIQFDVSLFPPTALGAVWGLIASPPCFIAGTPVLTRRGTVPIEQVQVGDEVWTHRNRWRPVVDTMTRTADTVRVGPVTATADHPFYTRPQVYRWNNEIRRKEWHLGDPVWTPAANARGEFLASPTRIADADGWQAMPVDPWLAGRYLADGWAGRDGIMIAVGAGKESQFEEETAPIAWTTAKAGKSCTRYTANLHSEAAWLREHFGHGADAKAIPTFILAAPADVRARFLAGYLSGDGYAKASGWVANTVSAALACTVRLLALSLGYTAQVREVPMPKTKIIEGRTVNQRNYWSVSIKPNDGRYTRDENDQHWTKQRKAVTDAGVAQVYDITVDEDHSFVAWGYVVHNCQGFSVAGKGLGRKDADALLAALDRIHTLEDVTRTIDELRETMHDPRSLFVLEPLRYLLTLTPMWTAWEQVPAVQPIWDRCAVILERLGWTTATGVLTAEQYGVPQTRKRAMFVAHHPDMPTPAKLPEPTHSRYYSHAADRLDPDVAPYVSMASALDWSEDVPLAQRSNYNKGGTGQRGVREISAPASTITSKRTHWQVIDDDFIPATVRTSMGKPKVDGRNGSHELDPHRRPSHTVTTKSDSWRAYDAGKTLCRPITISEVAVLQSFPADYPWRGGKSSQYRQCGDAVPPGLAAAVLSQIFAAATIPALTSEQVAA